jgi:4-amino-4-deoxy-L-arabinose transferase-like glycosyltransferase
MSEVLIRAENPGKSRPASERERYATLRDLMAIAFLWSVSLIIVNPSGNFPLNDDWAYGVTVKHLIQTGDFRPPDWPSMLLLTHVLWGSLFCIPASFSFNALRLSTLAMSLVGILAAYVLTRSVCRSRWMAVIAALTLAFNPVYYAVSNTFLTDAPFTALAVLASLFFVRSLIRDSDRDLLVGTMLATAATLSRQVGVAVPLAFAVSLLLRRGITKMNLARALIPPSVCFGAFWSFKRWLALTGRLPAAYSFPMDFVRDQIANPVKLVHTFTNHAYVVPLYLGWFLSPILVFALPTVRECRRKMAIAILSASFGTMLMLAAARITYRLSPLMPAWGNIMEKAGIGPLTLRDTFLLQRHMPELPRSFWLAVTILSVIGSALLIMALVQGTTGIVARARGVRMSASDAATTFLLLTAAILLSPFVVAPLFDRYLIPVLPFLAAGIAGIASTSACSPRLNAKGIRFAAAILLAVLAWFSVCGTRDYLAWNRLRWQALDQLLKSKRATPKDIDGGFEFNALYLYDPKYRQTPDKSWWWVSRDTYMIAFGPLPGYRLAGEYTYQHWMPPYAGKVVVLEKNPMPLPSEDRP